METSSFNRYFTFWFSTFANGKEPRCVNLSDKEFYIKTKDIAIKHGPIHEDYGLKGNVEKIFKNIFNDQQP